MRRAEFVNTSVFTSREHLDSCDVSLNAAQCARPRRTSRRPAARAEMPRPGRRGQGCLRARASRKKGSRRGIRARSEMFVLISNQCFCLFDLIGANQNNCETTTKQLGAILKNKYSSDFITQSLRAFRRLEPCFEEQDIHGEGAVCWCCWR